jgi:hypothetical protein
MTPAEHYAEAERLLAQAEAVHVNRLPPEVERLLLTAQVHATLAAARRDEP